MIKIYAFRFYVLNAAANVEDAVHILPKLFCYI